MRSLSVGLLMGAPLLSVLQQLFPALDWTLFLCPFILQGEDEDDEQAVADIQQAYAAVRAANWRAQDRLVGGAVWTQLDCVVCNALFVSLLGLRYSLRLVMLDITVGHAVAFTQAARCAMEALRANPVPRLKLSLVLNGRLAVFDAPFSPELGARLMHLTLCLLYAHESMWRDMSGAESDVDADAVPCRWDDLRVRPGPLVPLHVIICANAHSHFSLSFPLPQDAIRTALRPLRSLAYLRLVVHSNASDDNYALELLPIAHAREFVHALCGPASDFNLEAAAEKLVRPLPSLGYIFLTTSGCLSTHGYGESASGGAAGSGSSSDASERREVVRAWRVEEYSPGAWGT